MVKLLQLYIIEYFQYHQTSLFNFSELDVIIRSPLVVEWETSPLRFKLEFNNDLSII